MTPDEQHLDLRSWMEQRFDRIDDKIDRETKSLQDEIVQTRHGVKPLIEQLAIQLAQTTTLTHQNAAAVQDINAWRQDDGPLDARFHRHSNRINTQEQWRNTVRGGLIAASVFVPIVTGVVTGVVVWSVVTLMGGR